MPSPPRDLSPRLRAAGVKGVPDVGVSGSLITLPAPPTPDNLKPYRLSRTGQVGYQATMSPARAKDPQIPSDTVFGDTNNYSETAAACLSKGKPFALGEKIHQYKSDKAEPLGKARQYNYPLPPGSDIKVWGKVEKKSEAAKGIMYPSLHVNQENPKGEAGYQRERGYNWKGNFNDIRFGRQGPGLGDNFQSLGTSDPTCLVPSPTKAAREARHAQIGSTLVTGTAPAKVYDSSKTFGRTTQMHDGNNNVGYLMHGGDVPPKEDNRIGAAEYTSPRVRHHKAENKEKIDHSRSFGVPSVRTDKQAPEPHQLKITSGVSYAGDADASALLYQGDRSTVHIKGLSIDECLALNDKCMLGLQISEVRQAHALAAKRGNVTAGSFSLAVADMGL